MKTPKITLLEVQLGAVRGLSTAARNHEVAALAAEREIELLKELARERRKLAATEPQPEGDDCKAALVA
jgi:hypothetical protein